MKVKLPEENSGFTLYAEGNLFDMEYIQGNTILTFSDSHILALYYTYPNHRRLYMVCAKTKGVKTTLPCIDKPVSIIYKARGRRFDDIKNAMYFLKTHSDGEYVLYPLIFYRELAILAEQKRLKNWKINSLCLKHNLRLNNLEEEK